MADGVFNIAKGRAKEYYARVKSNDPAGSELVLILFTGTETDDDLEAMDTVAAIEAGNLVEVTDASYSRIDLTDSDLAAIPAPDDSADDNSYTLPDSTWSSLAGGDSITRLVVAYDPTGSSADSALIPLTFHDFVVTSNGGDVTADFGTDVFTAS